MVQRMIQSFIQHCPKRKVHLELTNFLLDFYPEIVEDDVNTLSGLKKILNNIKEGATHILIIQDDALPSKYLGEVISGMVSYLDDRVISFYSHEPQIEEAYKKGYDFLELDYLHGCVAYILPVEIALEFREFIPNLKESITSDDLALSTFFHLNDIKVLNTVPSLVDHLGWRESTQSKVQSMTSRVATRFMGIEKSGKFKDFNQNKVMTITKERIGHYLTKLK